MALLTCDTMRMTQRLDAVLRAMAPALSRHDARRLCDLGAVAIDGVRAAARQRVGPGQHVTCTAHAALSLQLGLAVLHEADGVLVVGKLPGQPSHSGPLAPDSVADRLAAALPGSGLAHRLDRPVSGLLLCGQDATALAETNRQAASGDIERDYVAIALGSIDGERRTIDLALRTTDQPMGNLPKVVPDAAGERAVTHLEVVARSRIATLVRLRLETGRTHQIRAHLLAIGHPVLGDPRYGDAAANQAARQTHGVDRPLLHSDRLHFRRTGVVVRAFAEPDMVRLFPCLAEPRVEPRDA